MDSTLLAELGNFFLLGMWVRVEEAGRKGGKYGECLRLSNRVDGRLCLASIY